MRLLCEKQRPYVYMAIIGEPTGMRGAIAERGLLVIDGMAKGISGHAARNEGVNALYIALEDINTLRSVRFDRISPTMGEVKLTVTQIMAGTQHNVVPDHCSFVVDIRPTEQYSNSEIMEILQPLVKSELKARNLTNRSSATPENHWLMKCTAQLGIETYTSPTTSDWMRITCPAIKMAGESSRLTRRMSMYLSVKLNRVLRVISVLFRNLLRLLIDNRFINDLFRKTYNNKDRWQKYGIKALMPTNWWRSSL